MFFERPLLLLLSLVAPLLFWLRSVWLARETKRLREFVRPALWERVDIVPPPERMLSRLLWSISAALLAVSAAGPAWGGSEAVVPAGGDNLALAVDVSASMASTDEVPSRLGRAALEVMRITGRLPSVRFSLILFSSQARLVVPGTLDREFLASRLPRSPLEETFLPAGTELGSLVDLMAASLPEEELETRVGVVFSDGGFHDFSLERSVEAAREAGLIIVTVGLGGPDSVPLPDGEGGVRTTAAGDTIRTALCEEPLRELAERTGGFYVPLSRTADLPDLLDELLEGERTLKAERIAGGSGGRRFHVFILAGLALALAALLLEGRRR